MEAPDARLIHVGNQRFALFPQEALISGDGPQGYIEEIVIEGPTGGYGAISVNARGILSPQQTRVLVLGCLSLSESESAEETLNTVQTIKEHRERLFKKLGVSTLAAAETECFEQKILEVVQGLDIPEPLSAKQKETLQLGSLGYTLYQIGRRMYIGQHTVRTHINRMYDKLGVYNMAEAVLFGRLYGILPQSSKKTDRSSVKTTGISAA